MSEDNKDGEVTFQGQGQSQGSQEVTPPDSEKPTEANAYLTSADLMAAMAKLEDSFTRKLQSMSAKSENRIAKKVEQGVKKWEENAMALGITPTREQIEAMKMNMLNLALSQEPPDTAETPSGQSALIEKQGSTATQKVDDRKTYADANLKRIQKKYGEQLMSNDPESATLNNIEDVDEWLEAYEEALKKKVARVGTPPNVRIPSGMSGAAGDGVSLSMVEEYRNQMIAARGDKAKVNEIKEKFRKKGLNVDQTTLFKRT